jgi:hypothetical protein
LNYLRGPYAWRSKSAYLSFGQLGESDRYAGRKLAANRGGGDMNSPGTCRKFLEAAAILATGASLTFVSPSLSHGTTGEHNSTAQAECTFSDGSTITFGRQDSKAAKTDTRSWRTGDYDATTLRVSEPMIFPPMENPIQLPAGSYTVFVMDNGNPPWTLIVSKKIGEWGMPYPGEQYDLGRTSLGSDVAPLIDRFTIGCKQHKDSPIFVWMQSGRTVGYAKILAVSNKDGKAEYLFR